MTDPEVTAEKADDLFVLSKPGRTVSFLPDIPSIAIHTATLIEGMHPFTEDCTLTGEHRYCAGYTLAGGALQEVWLDSGCDDRVVWDELHRWLDTDGPVLREREAEEIHRRNLAAGHWR